MRMPLGTNTIEPERNGGAFGTSTPQPFRQPSSMANTPANPVRYGSPASPVNIATPARARGGMMSFEEGTDRVPKTGTALIHKDEAVLNKHDAEKLRQAKGKNMAKKDVMKHVSESLGGKETAKPKKEISEMHIKKSANGGHISTHHHTSAEHPPEQHTTKTSDELADHVMQNMTEPNPGEAEMGQASPDASAGAPAPSPAGAASMPPAGM